LPFPTTYQILIESKSFPRSWERAVIIKDFFQIFGEVTGVNILAGNRVIVNFKEDLADRITGSLVQVRGRRREAGALLSLQVPWDRQPVFLRKVFCQRQDQQPSAPHHHLHNRVGPPHLQGIQHCSAVQCSAVRVGCRISLSLSFVYMLGRNC
jgi:hypothetical protein